MEDLEIPERLRLIEVIWTPTRRYRNRVIHVGESSVTVRSEQTERDREIPFSHIRDGATENGYIVQSIRIILGLEQFATA
jgi:hypothetical protein